MDEPSMRSSEPRSGSPRRGLLCRGALLRIGALMGDAVPCCGCRGLDAFVCHAVGIVRHTLRRDHGISGVCPVCILFVAWCWAWSSRRGVVRCCSVAVAKVQGGRVDMTRGRRTCSCS
ncbi:hypothetical protein TraAM80_09799 [Trypanosoma rangeli]|uniref:Uncharacterized protein n=1 Tax=Trypanosoma rangeli TaxID=5698 RepID=A0A422MTB2_TRYRA|nr:uncharacterized protein TraAM80_09799 [Trypanosoma rangeli]RNE96440.1 hypothetical protein TraAM80_09799 [Trypanosoma rangeli]|eukprot:RNE96440.1 hypothetical protein TraAM80_09799 [Trypanosoma rangeli]